MYVWVDALFNYISALEINGKTDLWPADIQIVGKDILKFHAIIWPALLLACGYDLPKKLLVHGFINVDGKKMSKSLGNVIAPQQLLERYGVDATRYLLFRQLSFYDDSNFTWEDFDRVYNGDLANGLGNLVARTIGLVRSSLEPLIRTIPKVELPVFPDFQYDLATINLLINKADQHISKHRIWVKPEDYTKEIAELANLIWEVSDRLEPFMPETAVEIRRQLTELDSKPLFPRLKTETL